MTETIQDKLLTRDQAYAATFRYLEIMQNHVRYEPLHSILCGMQLLEDAGSTDPACSQNWDRALNEVLDGQVDIRFRLLPIPPENKMRWRFWVKQPPVPLGDAQETENAADRINKRLVSPANEKSTVTGEQAYATTFRYLWITQEATNDELLHAMFSSMPLLADGMPADSACAQNWNQAANDVLDGKVDIRFRLQRTRQKFADAKLTQAERAVIRECLVAAVDGPFFEDPEFHTIFGLDRGEVRQVLNNWPNVDCSTTIVKRALNNTLNNLIGYPHGMEDHWDQYISISPAELDALFDSLSLPRGIM